MGSDFARLISSYPINETNKWQIRTFNDGPGEARANKTAMLFLYAVCIIA